MRKRFPLKLTLIGVCLIGLFAIAPRGKAQQPTPEQQQEFAMEKAAAVDGLLDTIASMRMIIKRRNAELVAAQAEIARLMKLCGAPCKPKEEPKK